jgi:hypothetical protein
MNLPIIPNFSTCIGIGQEFLPGMFHEAFPAGTAGFALSCLCIATDNSKGEHCYYIS